MTRNRCSRLLLTSEQSHVSEVKKAWNQRREEGGSGLRAITLQALLSKLAQPGVPLRAGWEWMLCEGKGSLGEGFFDYSAGVPRDGVEKISFGMKNYTFLFEKYNIGAQKSKIEPKWPKVNPTGSKREPKVSQREPKGSQKGAQRKPQAFKLFLLHVACYQK